jgi:hypothetical protein
MKYYQESLSTAKLTSPKAIEEVTRNMLQAHSIMGKEGTGGQGTVQKNKEADDEVGQGEMTRILGMAEHAVGDLDAAKCGALQGFEDTLGEVFVGVFGDVNLTEVLDSCEKVFQQKAKSAQVQSTKEWPLLAEAMKQLKPAVCLFVRRCEATSGEPDDTERQFLHAIKTQMHFVGAMFWLVEDAFKPEIWSKTAGVSICKKVKIVATLNPKPIQIDCAEADLEDATQGSQIFEDASKVAELRKQQAQQKLENKKRDLLLAIDGYCLLKEKSSSRGPEQFYDHVKDNISRRHCLEGLVNSEFRITIPDVSLFHQEPFIESIAEVLDGQQIAKVKERQIRHFLQSVISSQLMAHGRELGEEIHELIMGQVVSILIADYFGITEDKIPVYLEEYCSREEDKSDRLDDHTACEFLLKENFISMYVGGTVLACAPLMLGMINPPLRPNDEVTEQFYAEDLKIAEDHYESMGRVGIWNA